MLRDRLTLLIHSCDKFSDLWEAHTKLLNQNWADRNIRTMLVSDKIQNRTLAGVDLYFAGEGMELSERTKYALQFIETEYVLITLDDYFPIYKINSAQIERLLDIMDKENLDYIRLFSDPNSHKKFKNYDKLYEISLDTNYQVNLYQGIWRKAFIEKTIGEKMNAWQYEVSLTKIAESIGAKCVLSKGKEFELLDVVRKGKLLNKANRYLKKHDLYHGSREVISRKEEFRIYIFNHGKKILPKWLAVKVKNFLRKRGHKFYSESL